MFKIDVTFQKLQGLQCYLKVIVTNHVSVLLRTVKNIK